MFLIYLLLGHVANVWLTKHCMLKCALVFRWQLGYLCSNCCGCNYYEAFFATFSHHNGVFKFSLFTDVAFLLPLAIVCIFKFTVCILSGGIFEANCHSVWVRSTTPKLITFIHWYYWSQNLGGLILFYCVLVSMLLDHYVSTCTCSKIDNGWHDHVLLPLIGIITFIAGSTAIFFLYIYNRSFYIQRAGLNPFKNIYRVLKYAWKHKVPERCSAFIYWEEDIPLRIHLGKDKYGGSFTTEEMEDTKTFLCILYHSSYVCLDTS